MRVVIIGAGVVGATTAYFIARRGHDVTLLERREHVALETSFANAAQLSYSYTDTLAGPGFISKLPAMLLGRDVGMRIRLDPALIAWGLRFLSHCNRRAADRGTLQLLDLAAASRSALEWLLTQVPLEFGRRAAGKLMVTASAETLANLQRRAEQKRQHGVTVEIIDYRRCCELEPALAAWRGRIAGAAYAPSDDVGDAHRFTRALCEHLVATRLGRVLTNIEARKLLLQRGRIVGVQTGQGDLEADVVVICAGIRSRALLRTVGLAVPLYPLKGYSVTAAAGPTPTQMSITDVDRRIVFATLRDRVRLAGFADCRGNDTTVDARRIADLVGLGRSVLPDAAQFEGELQAWAGLRPATPSGLPIVGPTRVRGLYLNVGHGGLGWTLACGSAQQLAACLQSDDRHP